MYTYKSPTSHQSFGLLPLGDYDFEVTRCGEPYENDRGNVVLSVRLAILPDRVTVFANPWSGDDKNGKERDLIAEFLLCVGRAPAEGAEPDWAAIVGARGRCRLKTETAQRGKRAGQEVNVVAWFYWQQDSARAHDTLSDEARALGQGGTDQTFAGHGVSTTNTEPDDIPF